MMKKLMINKKRQKLVIVIAAILLVMMIGVLVNFIMTKGGASPESKVMMQLKFDKTKYYEGDTAAVTVTVRNEGRSEYLANFNSTCTDGVILIDGQEVNSESSKLCGMAFTEVRLTSGQTYQFTETVIFGQAGNKIVTAQWDKIKSQPVKITVHPLTE